MVYIGQHIVTSIWGVNRMTQSEEQDLKEQIDDKKTMDGESMTTTINDVCPQCKKGTMVFYDGWLGYASIQCNFCHFDVNDYDVKDKPLIDGMVKA